MAKLIGAVGTSHSPGIARAYDQGLMRSPEWTGFFTAYENMHAWIKEKKVDVILFLYNDHLNNFEINNYPTFALGLAEEMPVLDEGFGKRNFNNVPSNQEFGKYLAKFLVNEEFDISLCHELGLDHGIMSILPMMVGDDLQVPVVPLAVNVIQEPLPKPKRLWKLGQCLGKAVESYPEDINVLVVSAGGLSHHLQGSSFGETNEPWDKKFMQLIESNPAPLIEASHDEYMRRGGAEGVEMMLWLGMKGAIDSIGKKYTKVLEHYSVPGITACGIMAFEVEHGD